MKKKRFRNILQIPLIFLQIKPNAHFRKYMNERRTNGTDYESTKSEKKKKKGQKGTTYIVDKLKFSSKYRGRLFIYLFLQ